MDDATVLPAIQDIRNLKARYFFCLDSKDWRGWGNVFASDAILDVRGEYPDAADPNAHLIYGRAAIVAAVSAALRDIVTVHHGHTPLIELSGNNSARGIWAMEDNLFMPDGSRMTGFGHYHEEYAGVDNAWRITRSRLTRLHKLFAAPASAAPANALREDD